jgi:hypothetical protein
MRCAINDLDRYKCIFGGGVLTKMDNLLLDLAAFTV